MEQKRGSIFWKIDWWTLLLYASLAFMGWLAICGASYSYVETGYLEFLDPGERTGKQAMWMGVSMLFGAFLLCIKLDIFPKSKCLQNIRTVSDLKDQ